MKSLRKDMVKQREDRTEGFVKYLNSAYSVQQVSISGTAGTFLASENCVVSGVMALCEKPIRISKTAVDGTIEVVGSVHPDDDGRGYLTGFELSCGEVVTLESEKPFTAGMALITRLRFGSWGQ